MVEDREFNRYNVADSSLESLTGLLDFCTEIQGPRRIGSRGVKNGRNIVFQNYGSKESNVDVPRNLENVFVLPKGSHVLRCKYSTYNKLEATYHFFWSSLSASQGLYFPSSFTDNRSWAI